MRKAALTLALILAGCSHPAYESVSPLADVQHKRDALVNAFDPASMPRCDKLTFLALVDAFTKRDMRIDSYEFPSGKWNRDLEPCYPDESKSQTSLDGYLSVLHLTQSRRDARIAERILSYAEPLDWLTGEGPAGIVSIYPLAGMVRQLAGKTSVLLDRSGDASFGLEGFRGHLLASYIWLSGRVYGEIPPVWLYALRMLAKETPESPFFDALVHRYSDGDYREALSKLSAMTDPSVWWGSAPLEVYYAITVAVMEGK